MAAVAGATIGALLTFTLPKVVSLIGHRNVRSLESELKYIVAALQDYAKTASAKNHLGRAWIEDIRLFADEIEYCIDSFVVEVMSPGRDAGFFRRAALRAKKMAVTRTRFSFKIRKLDKEAKEINQRYLRYKDVWKSDGASSSTAASTEVVGNEFWQPPVKVGIDKPADELLKLVTASGAESERKLKVISIVGFGGLGKTLLASEVYSHEDVREQFTVRARVEAASKGAEEVVKELLLQIRQFDASSNPMNNVVDWRTSGIKQLSRLLGNTRYLIVIDDMQIEELCDLIPHFPAVNGVDSRIIVTTTIQNVARKCSYDNDRGCVYKLNRLSDEDSKELFFHVFSSGECSKASEQELQSSALLKKCDGLPLALVCTARFLKHGTLEKSRCDDACHKLCDSEQTDFMLHRMRRQLVNYYESLYMLGLQDLLLYFSMFPRDHPVRRKALIRRWLAEGLITLPLDAGSDGTNSWDVALNKLKALIDRNIIQSMEVSMNGDAKSLQTPGMILEYISRKSMTQHFTLFCSEMAQEQGGGCVRRLSLRPETTAANLPKNMSRLRTLAVFPRKNLPATTSGNNPGQGEALLDLQKYKMLRVLDLEECYNLSNEHLQKICNLLLLRYLSLGEGVTKVPENISKLRLLETLDLRKTKIKSVPVQVIQLPGLKHLLGKFEAIEGDRRKCNLQLLRDSKLETLSGFVTGRSEEIPQLVSHMENLKKVKLWCKSAESDTSDLDRQLGEAIEKFIHGGNEVASRSLSIDLQGWPEVLLDNLKAGGSLVSLKLRGDLNGFPKFIPQLNHIKELCLSFTNLSWGVVLTGTESKFELKTLKYLKLMEEELGPLEIRHEHFPSLERLCLVGVTSVDGIKTGDLQYLESLHMICAALDGMAGIQLRRFKNLKEIAILSTVGDVIKEKWQDEAMKHPRTPQVSLIPSPKCTARE